MTIKIRVIFDYNNCGKEYKTSVVEYAKTILADSSYEANYPGINELVNLCSITVHMHSFILAARPKRRNI